MDLKDGAEETRALSPVSDKRQVPFTGRVVRADRLFGKRANVAISVKSGKQ